MHPPYLPLPVCSVPKGAGQTCNGMSKGQVLFGRGVRAELPQSFAGVPHTHGVMPQQAA